MSQEECWISSLKTFVLSIQYFSLRNVFSTQDTHKQNVSQTIAYSYLQCRILYSKKKDNSFNVTTVICFFTTSEWKLVFCQEKHI